MELKTVFNLKDDCWTIEGTTVKKQKVEEIEVTVKSYSTQEYIKCEFGGIFYYVGTGKQTNQAFKTEEEMTSELIRRINGGNVPK